jgi:hypothetical protein
MKKANKARAALLQKKRTKRNIARKGVKYDPTKMERRASTPVQAGTPSSSTAYDSNTVLTV